MGQTWRPPENTSSMAATTARTAGLELHNILNTMVDQSSYKPGVKRRQPLLQVPLLPSKDRLRSMQHPFNQARRRQLVHGLNEYKS
jgi:hypothetical protein